MHTATFRHPVPENAHKKWLCRGTLIAETFKVDVSLEFAVSALVTGLLVAVLLQTIRMRGMLSQLTLQNTQLKQASGNDDLTGLTNRRILQEILGLEIAQAKRSRGRVGLAILDVDGLKLVNDGLGVAAGDQVLTTLAERLGRLTRESDTLARLGGDQFALLISRCDDLSEILTAVERLRGIWAEPLSVDGHQLRISCSIGLSVFPDDAGDPAELLRNAGTAVGQAQEQGADRLSVFDESSNRLARERLVRGQELREALRDGQFELHVQPQVSLPDGRLTGGEGLVRWRHPVEGLLSAARFIPLAEQIGLMPQISTWVLEEICRQNSVWQEAGLKIVPISVNVSARHFRSDDVPGVVAGILRATRLDSRFLHLEVTESAALHDVELMTAELGRLKKMGILLHLDDFGTGYSSLSYLMRYPLDVLKIDRSFVSELHAKDHSRAIVKATIAMADSLGMDVVAEGIETEQELGCLVELGCRSAQGFLLGKPMPCDEFERLLEAGRVAVPGSQAA